MSSVNGASWAVRDPKTSSVLICRKIKDRFVLNHSKEALRSVNVPKKLVLAKILGLSIDRSTWVSAAKFTRTSGSKVLNVLFLNVGCSNRWDYQYQKLRSYFLKASLRDESLWSPQRLLIIVSRYNFLRLYTKYTQNIYINKQFINIFKSFIFL